MFIGICLGYAFDVPRLQHINRVFILRLWHVIKIKIIVILLQLVAMCLSGWSRLQHQRKPLTDCYHSSYCISTSNVCN